MPEPMPPAPSEVPTPPAPTAEQLRVTLQTLFPCMRFDGNGEGETLVQKFLKQAASSPDTPTPDTSP